MSILSVKQLSVFSKEKPLVDRVSFDIQHGEWFALVGQSGSGKSITAAAIGRLLEQNLTVSGEVLYKGQNLLQLKNRDMRKMRGKNISFVFQDYQGTFAPFLTIGRHFDDSQKAHAPMPKKQRIQQAKKALASVGLPEDFYTRYPSQLSGGQLQRAAIALALLFKPDLVIADEPSTALDGVTAANVLKLLADLKEQTNCAVLFITHDLRHVRKYANRLAVMLDGEVVECEKAETILTHPAHSYTKKLFAAVPPLRETSASL